MSPVIIIVGLFALYLYLENRNVTGAGGLFGGGTGVSGGGTPLPGGGVSQATLAPVIQGGQVVSTPVETFKPPTSAGMGPSQTTTGLVSTGLGAGTAVGTTALVGSGVIAGGSVLAVAIPVVGVVAAALFAAFMAASARRAAAARNENSAVAGEVPIWDSQVQQVVAAYNKGQINLSEFNHAMMVPQNNDSSVPSGQGVLWQAYWKVVGPQVQSGRNGCHSGADIQPSTQSWCGGNAASVDSRTYGAGCCVAYDNLKNGSVWIMEAAAQADAHPGQTVTSKVIPTVYASKYGGINRPGYSVTLRRPATIGV